MRDKGLSRKVVLAELRKVWEQDLQYEDGRILCSMCTAPHYMAKTAHSFFSRCHLGDLGLFSGSPRLEKEVIQKLATLLSGPTSVGFLVSGGREANLLALLAARNIPEISNPEVVLPKSAHFSFTRICNLLGLRAVARANATISSF